MTSKHKRPSAPLEPPVSIAAAQDVARVRAVRLALLTLHKVLIDTERRRYERSRGLIETPHHALQLLMQDPFFVWLRPMAQIIVEMDEWLWESSPRPKPDARVLLDHVRGLLTGTVVGDVFHAEYRRALQDTPEVVVAHADVTRLLAADDAVLRR